MTFWTEAERNSCFGYILHAGYDFDLSPRATTGELLWGLLVLSRASGWAGAGVQRAAGRTVPLSWAVSAALALHSDGQGLGSWPLGSRLSGDCSSLCPALSSRDQAACTVKDSCVRNSRRQQDRQEARGPEHRGAQQQHRSRTRTLDQAALWDPDYSGCTGSPTPFSHTCTGGLRLSEATPPRRRPLGEPACLELVHGPLERSWFLSTEMGEVSLEGVR